jgi:hypothetical protein
VLPYDRGDLVSRVHESGEVLEEQHNEAGTRLRARVSEALAGELASYATTRAYDRSARPTSWDGRPSHDAVRSSLPLEAR